MTFVVKRRALRAARDTAQQPDDARKITLRQFTAAYAKYKASSDAKSPRNDDYKAAYDVANICRKYGSSNDDYSSTQDNSFRGTRLSKVTS